MDKYEKIDYSNKIPYKIGYGYLEDRDAYIESHWHNSVEIILPIYGSVRLMDNGKEVILKDTEFYIVNSRHVHSLHWCGDTEMYMGGCLQIDYQFIKELSKQIEEIEFAQPKSEQEMLYGRKLIFEMIKENDKELFFKNIYIESQLLMLLYALFKYMRVDKPRISSNGKQNKKIADIVKYIEENYKEDISVEMIANHFGLSSGYLTKLFKDNIGKAPKEYLLQYRLKKAERSLTETNDAIIDIALNHGFVSLNSFYTQFKKIYGVSPARYRKIHDENESSDDTNKNR